MDIYFYVFLDLVCKSFIVRNIGGHRRTLSTKSTKQGSRELTEIKSATMESTWFHTIPSVYML